MLRVGQALDGTAMHDKVYMSLGEGLKQQLQEKAILPIVDLTVTLEVAVPVTSLKGQLCSK